MIMRVLGLFIWLSAAFLATRLWDHGFHLLAALTVIPGSIGAYFAVYGENKSSEQK